MKRKEIEEALVTAWALEILSKEFNSDDLKELAEANRKCVEDIAKKYQVNMEHLKAKVFEDLLPMTNHMDLAAKVRSNRYISMNIIRYLMPPDLLRYPNEDL